MVVGVEVAMIVSAGPIHFGAQAPSPPPPQAASPENALRSRVEEFYSLLQLGKWNEAEAYITEETRAEWRQEAKSRFTGFDVQSLALDPDGKSAKVIVRVYTPNPRLSTPIPFAQTTPWRVVGGRWFCEIHRATMAEIMAPFTRSVPGAGAVKPTPPELKFKGRQYGLGNVQRNEVKTARFPFTNVSDHDVTVSSVEIFCKCLKAKLAKRTFKPGESGELVIDFDPSGTDYEGFWGESVMVRTEPGETSTLLNVTAFVALQPRGASQTAPKPASSPSSQPANAPAKAPSPGQ